MLKIFVQRQTVFLILVVTTTINASRLFYFPLPKIHPSHGNENLEQKSNDEQILLPSFKNGNNEQSKNEELVRLDHSFTLN